MIAKSLLAGALLVPVFGLGAVAIANAHSLNVNEDAVLVGGTLVSQDESSFVLEVEAEADNIAENLVEYGISDGDQIVVEFDDDTRMKEDAEWVEGDMLFARGTFEEGVLDANAVSAHPVRAAVRAFHNLKHRAPRGGEVISIDTETNTVVVEGRDGEERTIEYEDDAEFTRIEFVSENDINVGDVINVKSILGAEGEITE